MANKNYEALIEIGGKVNPSLRKATSSACQCLDNINNTIKNTVSGGVGALAALFTVDKAKQFGSAMLDSAETMESYRTTLNIVMKDNVKAAKMMKWAVDFANKTPFDTESVVEASVKLTSYGMNAQQTLTDIGNMAAVMNKPLNQAAEAVAKAQTGELEMLKEFGITKNMIAKKANEMYRGQTIINNKGQIADTKKFNDALFALMKDRYTNGMIEQSKTWKGIKSTVTGVWQTAMAQIAGISKDGTIKAESFFDVITQKGYDLSVILQQLANDGTFERISTKLGEVLNFTMKCFTVAGQVYGFIKSTFIPSLVILSGVFGGMAVKKVTIAIQMFRVQQALAAGQSGVLAALMRGQLFTALRLAAVGAWQTAAAFIAANLPFILAGIAIAGVVAVIILLVKHWDVIKAKVIEVANIVITYGVNAWNSLVTALQNAWAQIKPILETIGNAIKTAFNFTPVGIAINTAKAVAGKIQEQKATQPAKNAMGSASFGGGSTLVGEQGAELVNLPRGSRIFSNTKTNNILSGTGGSVNVNITINGNADPSSIQNAASTAFEDFKAKYYALMSRNKRLGLA